ncbi:MAG: metalloregulator ArsR/SmtB family transcription factor [Nanoarchaeota archaeon]|nr:metalloregulator ArsR/SmtB family transcription factor [Nanoarchaeota archaeon]
MNKSTYHVFFSNLSNPLRISIITSLKEKEKNVTEISRELKVEQSKISHALRNLKKCKLVDVKQRGKQRIYSLNKKTLVPMLNLIDKHANTYCKCECCANKNCGGKKK